MTWDPSKLTFDSVSLLKEACNTGMLYRIKRPSGLSIIANDQAFSKVGDSTSELRWDEAIGTLRWNNLIEANPASSGLQRYHVTYEGYRYISNQVR